MPADSSKPENWSSEDKLAVVIETAAMNEVQLSEYCRSKGLYAEQVEQWKAPALSLKLLHQLAHAERCEIQGGRDRFVTAWLRHLPEDVITALEQGDPINTERIHFAMFMESHANNRAESICRRLRCERD